MKKILPLFFLCCSTILMAQKQDFVETYNELNMRFVWVEGGTFDMGCTNEQQFCEEDEQNIRSVKISGFYMAIFEVTQKQWKTIMGNGVNELIATNPSDFHTNNTASTFGSEFNEAVDELADILTFAFDEERHTPQQYVLKENIGANGSVSKSVSVLSL